MSLKTPTRFTRYFIITGLIGVLVVVVVLGQVFQREQINNLLAIAESKNTDMVQIMSNELFDYYFDQLGELENLTATELRQNSVALEFDKRVRAFVGNLDLQLVSIVSLNGVTLLSTNPRNLGELNKNNEFDNAIKSGETVSTLNYQDLVSSMESLQVHRHTVTSYIPLMRQGDSSPVAVAELRTDVTSNMDSINNNSAINYFVTAGMLSGLFLFLFLLARKAGTAIKQLTARIDKQDKLLKHQRYHDTLTGLPNRIRFLDALDHEMKLCKLKSNLIALLFIDLDYFQKVNDALGYSIGDKLLMDVSERLKQCVRSGDTVARIGGDEFVIILQSINVLDEAEEITRQILSSVAEVYSFEGEELFMSPSIGIAMYPFTDDDANTLLKKANSAMKKAKQAGRNTFRYFTENTRKQLISRFSTENYLRRALERDEFQLYYQPIVQIHTGRIVSVEALLRWDSPEQGFMSPEAFIPLLEETGLIIPVGQWVIENACKQGVQWNRGGIYDLKINVNMSARQLLHKDLIKQVNDALEISGLPSHLLDLEITESLLIEDFSNTIHILDNLNDLGISLSIDDFGTGYSSLSYLKRMPVDTLKIDQSFVRDIAVNMDDAAIVEAICALSHSLRFKVTAEGLESSDQLEHLRRAGVNQVQGFLLSKPVPASELEPLLRQKKILISSESVA